MKQIILSISIIFFNLSAFSQIGEIKNLNQPKMKFETEMIDYGTIKQNANGIREFKFVNSGNNPLIISHAQQSCGCTIPTWPKTPIKPGESSVIKVKYDTKRLGAFSKMVTIESNAERPSIVLRIKGTVNKPETNPIAEKSGKPIAK